MVRYGCEADGGSTVNQYVGGRPSMERGTYESGFLRAVRFAAIVVVYTLPGEQHVVENNVTLFLATIGDPQNRDDGISAPVLAGLKTSVAPTENRLVFQLYSVKPQPSTRNAVAEITHTSTYVMRTLTWPGGEPHR